MLVIGDYAVGKTSIIKRYTEGFYTPNYKLTIGVDFAVKGAPLEIIVHPSGIASLHCHSLYSIALGCCSIVSLNDAAVASVPAIPCSGVLLILSQCSNGMRTPRFRCNYGMSLVMSALVP